MIQLLLRWGADVNFKEAILPIYKGIISLGTHDVNTIGLRVLGRSSGGSRLNVA